MGSIKNSFSYSNPIDLSLVLPAYNEEGNIAAVIEQCRSWLDQVGMVGELVVIDNCSQDSTIKIVRQFVAEDPRVRLIQHTENKLYSGSCQTGLKEARGYYVAIMDSDGQYFARDLSAMIKEIDAGSDLVLGWRVDRQDPLSRKLMSGVFKLLGRLYLDCRLHDLNCGLKIMSRRFVDSVKVDYRINMVNPELFRKCQILNLRCSEIPIQHAFRLKGQTSHGLSFKRSIQILLEVVRYFRSLQSLRLGVPSHFGPWETHLAITEVNRKDLSP